MEFIFDRLPDFGHWEQKMPLNCLEKSSFGDIVPIGFHIGLIMDEHI
jgi:hypothetical protein